MSRESISNNAQEHEARENRRMAPWTVISESLSGLDEMSLKKIAEEFADAVEKEITGLGTKIPQDLKEIEALIDNENLDEARTKIGFLATLGHDAEPGWSHNRYMRDKEIIEKYGATLND